MRCDRPRFPSRSVLRQALLSKPCLMGGSGWQVKMVTLPTITDTFGTIMASANELNRLCRCRANPIPLYYYNVFMGTRGAGFMATMTLFEILSICILGLF